MRDKSLRLLVISDQPDDVQLLEEAFLELEEIRYTRGWLQPVRRTYAVDPEEALQLANPSTHDAILLSLDLCDGEALLAFRELQRHVPGIPIILLAGNDQEITAMNLMRQGAQDYILKFELDCIPLARALYCAVARQSLLECHKSVSLVDDLSGLWNARGFELIGRTQLEMASRCGLTALVATAELEPGRAGDVELLEAADKLRGVFQESNLLARLEGGRFASLVVPAAGELPAWLELASGAKIEVRWATLEPSERSAEAGTMQSTLSSLCENVGVAAARAGRHL